VKIILIPHHKNTGPGGTSLEERYPYGRGSL
jgi:hypothetical protein